jgi:hypothetical protein
MPILDFPVSLVKTFTTRLSKEEVISFVRERINSRTKFLFLSMKDYKGSISGNTFELQKAYSSQHSPSFPKIQGKVISGNPTTVELEISPPYFRILFFLIFPTLFVPAFVFSDEITINGVLRTPSIIERISFAGVMGIGPLVWCFFDCIWPIWKAEKWLKQELSLEESHRPFS